MRKFILLLLLLIPCVAYGQSKKQLDSDSDGAIDLDLGGTGVSFTDPGADRLWFWDDSFGDMAWLIPDSYFTITGTTLSLSEGTLDEVLLSATNGPTDNYVLSYDSVSGGFTWIIGAGGLGSVAEDTTPELGGNLNILTFSIAGVDAAEFGYLDGVTSDLQTQINNVSSDLVTDTTPQLGGELDLNAQTVTDASGIDDDDCTGDQGKYWWDSTDNQWEFCNLDTGIPITVGSGTPDLSGDYEWTGENIFSGTISLPYLDDLAFSEQADHSSIPAAGYGYLWTRSDAPSSLVFTDDTGTDYDLTQFGGGTSITLSPIVIAEPDQVQDITDSVPLYHFIAESYPSGVTITSIHISTSATNTDDMNFEEWSNNGTAWSTDSTVEAITLSGTHTEDDGTLSDANLAADAWLYVDLDDAMSDIAYLSITISFTSQ